MKAISIKQPWVYAVLREGKDIENRSRRRHFRGWIAVHASATPRHGARLPRGSKTPDLKTLDFGAICGVARVVDIVTLSRSKWFNQPSRGYVNYGWVLADVKRLRTPDDDRLYFTDLTGGTAGCESIENQECRLHRMSPR